jgi:hypothetical protein
MIALPAARKLLKTRASSPAAGPLANPGAVPTMFVDFLRDASIARPAGPSSAASAIRSGELILPPRPRLASLTSMRRPWRCCRTNVSFRLLLDG